MNRRDFIRSMNGLLAGYGASQAWPLFSRASESGANADAPLEIGDGVQLFLDDFLIERMDGLKRQVQQPERLDQPILDHPRFGTTQPFLSIVHDDERKRYRLWYNRGPEICLTESTDGVHWDAPQVVLKKQRFCCSVVDDGPNATDPRRRFKMALNGRIKPRKQGQPGDEGMWVWFSPDGVQWTSRKNNPALLNYPEGYPRISRHSISDIIDAFYDPLRKQYAAAVKMWALPEDGYAKAPRAGDGFRRLVGISTSEDFVNWGKPQRILTPEKQDEGFLEFYGMGGVHFRGDLAIGLVRVLRDDLPCDPGGPPDGIGYTVLAGSRDGIHWNRLRDPFLNRNHEPGSWDHAMTWGSAVMPVGDELFIYYGGYARGHKVGRETQRQIGMARMKRDRYMALVPKKDEGVLRTKPFFLPEGKLTVNAQAADGSLRVRLLDAQGQPLGEESEWSEPISGDVLAGAIVGKAPFASQVRKPVRLEFLVRNASLFGFAFA